MLEDFSRALVKLFLVGNYEKYAVPVTAEGGTLIAQMPQDIPDGAYSLEAIWVKNYNNLFPVKDTDTPSVGTKDIRYPGACHPSYGMKHPWDYRSNDRSLMRSRKDYVFAVTSYPGEETAVNQDGYVTIKINSAVATYGYDGLSAYEIAVMRGDFNGTEKEFLAKNITNNPDDEDLTTAKEGGYDVIKFADKEYNELNYSGIGRVYLRKNIISEINKNVLTQDMIKKANTRYIVQYDYDLVDENVTIPEGCILDFEGGSLNNGTITFSENTYVKNNFKGNASIVGVPYYIDYKADEEDITTESGVAKLKDKEYDVASFSGMGRIYLRKNIVGGKNVLTQKMVNSSNTIYIIQYDYELNSQTITIPKGCILKFEGGSFSNGIVNGDNTKIYSKAFVIFNNVILNGKWEQNEVYSNWFYIEDGSDSTIIFKNLMILASSRLLTHIYIERKIFNISLCNTEITMENYEGIKIPSNVYIHNSATIKALPSDVEKSAIFLIHGDSNITIDGGELIGDVETHIGDSGEWGYGISLVGASNVVIKNITISKCWGDGINIQAIGTSGEEDTHCKNVTVDNVRCLSNRRQGMSIEGCIGATVTNSDFSDTGSIKSTNPGAGIDIEPWFAEEVVTDIKIDNCRFFNNKTYLCIYGNKNTKGITISNCFSDYGVWIRTSNVTIDNFQCSKDSLYGYLAIWETCHNISITNSYFTNEIYARGNLNNVSISNSTFMMSEEKMWSGFAICFENANENCKYKNVIISNCAFIDTNKVRFLMASSDESVNISFINNSVNTGCTQPFSIGYGDFIGNSIVATSANGINIKNITGKSVNIIGNKIFIQRYVDYILSFDGEKISTESTYDCIISNTIISVNQYFTVANNNSNNYKVLVINSNLGGDIVSQLYNLSNWTYIDKNTCIYSKEYTPLVSNAIEGKCYLYKIPFKRGMITLYTSNKYTTKQILYNTITNITVNPDKNIVDINPTYIISSIETLDNSDNSEFPRIGYNIVDEYVYIYIKNGAESVYGLRTKLNVDFQESIEYSNIGYNIVDIPSGVIFDLKLKGILKCSSIPSDLKLYQGFRIIDSKSDKELVYDGTQWLNIDGTLYSKVLII